MRDRFISYLNEQWKNHCIYVWGAQGQRPPELNEEFIYSQETDIKNALKAVSLLNKRLKDGYGSVIAAYDCSGLGVSFFLEHGLIANDMTAHELMKACRMISFEELAPGDFVFKTDDAGHAYHIGYIVNSALGVIEAKGRSYGVVKSGFKDWNAFGRPLFFAC